ncbi:MAG: hypothetical protein OHK0047_31100 [Leptolyngbyaceae cyanobacterium]
MEKGLDKDQAPNLSCKSERITELQVERSVQAEWYLLEFARLLQFLLGLLLELSLKSSESLGLSLG